MKKILIAFIVLSTYHTGVIFGAELFLVQTKDVRTGLIVFDVMLDPEGEQVNAFSATISIPSQLVQVESLDTVGSIVPLWVTRPSVFQNSDSLFYSEDKSLIVFDGVLPGGFDGIRSPYYEGKRSGKILTITLRPKSKGVGTIVFDDARVLKNDGKATPALLVTGVATIAIPNIKELPAIPKKENSSQWEKQYNEAKETTLDAYVVRNDAISDGKWVVLIEDDSSRHTITNFRVAESNSAITEDVPFYEWKNASSPYTLSFQKRNRFIHVQALYADQTRSTKIIPPVENASDGFTLWRILVSIAIGALIVYILQRRHALSAFFKHQKFGP